MKRLLPWLVALLVVAAWSGAAAAWPPVLLPSPLEVLQAVGADPRALAAATATTAGAALGGLGIAALVGIAGGVAFWRSRALELALHPWALFLQTVPVVAIAPLLLVWLGYGTRVPVLTSAIVSFFPILTAARTGLRSVPDAQVDLFRLHGATAVQELRLLRLPASLPHLFSGFRTAVGLAVIGAIVGEFVASNGQPPCLGHLVLWTARSAQTPRTFAAIFAATALALGLHLLVRQAERRMIGRWHPGART